MAAHSSHAPLEAGAELPRPVQKTLVTPLEVGRTLLSHDEARFMLFCENVHINGKNRLEGLGTEPKLL